MNRWDEIQATARTIAEQIAPEAGDRNELADELIKLVGLMIGATGKVVAVDGEGAISDPDDPSAHGRYLVGESMQTGARTVVEEASGADLERYERAGLPPVWTPRPPSDPDASCGTCHRFLRLGHFPGCSQAV